MASNISLPMNESAFADAEASAIVDNMMMEVMYFICGFLVLRALIVLGAAPKSLGSLVGLRERAGPRAKCAKITNKTMPKGSAVSAEPSWVASMRAFTRSSHPLESCRKLLDLRGAGTELPASLSAEVFRAAAKGAWGSGVLQEALAVGSDLLSIEGVRLALAECQHRDDCEGAAALEQAARERGIRLSFSEYERLLKIFCKVPDQRAPATLASMLAAGCKLPFFLTTHLLARCADSQNLVLAERLHSYLRGQKQTDLVIYKTLMKVYVACGRFDLACSIYELVLEDGLEPDSQMYGCLAKCASKCDRTDLSKQLLEKISKQDASGTVWLIRAAGRDGDTAKAVQMLRELQAGEADSLAAYNCTLEALVHNGAMDKAEELFAEMKSAGMLSLMAYGSIMKGYCSLGQLARARRMLAELEADGKTPDCVCYNSLLSAAVSKGDLRQAWDIVDEMERKGAKPDNYTLSIMLKAARRDKSPRSHPRSPAARALAMLDAVGMRVSQDEILFNTALDACAHFKDHRRLAALIKAFDQSSIQPTVHSYGLLIKACSILQRHSRCWSLWYDMVEQRSMMPNDITLACMLDFLASCGQADEAMKLWEQWKPHVPANTIIYSTLMKGFANTGDVRRSTLIFHEMTAAGLEMNTVTYTTLLDAHARARNMAPAMALLRRMEEDNCVPNKITYSALIKGFCNVGDLAQARSVYDLMLQKGFQADSVVFNTLLDGCVRHQDWQSADLVLSELAKSDEQGTAYTLCIIVKMWGKRQNLDAAFSAVQAEVRAARFPMDSQVGSALLSACVNNQAFDRAIGVIKDLKRWPGSRGPNEDCYAVLIAGLARAGRERCQQALVVAEEACQALGAPRAGGLASPAPFYEAFVTLQKELCKHGLTDEKRRLMTKFGGARRAPRARSRAGNDEQ